VAGAQEPGAVTGVETELFHAHPFQSDDTSAIRVQPACGIPVVVAVTLCAADRAEPYILVHGEHGTIRLTYTMDEVLVGDGPVRRFPRTDLLVNLVEHIRLGPRCSCRSTVRERSWRWWRPSGRRPTRC
jgi:hypothetical protein